MKMKPSILKDTLMAVTYRFLSWLSPKILLSLHYKRVYKKRLNWDNLSTIDEKISWLKLNADTTKWSLYTDKYRVREHLKEMGLGNLLVKLYGKWDKPEDIEWAKLPQQFIVKTNNGSGEVLICKDKSKEDIGYMTVKVRKMSERKTGSYLYEPHYDSIKPCIIAEELLDVSKQAIESSSVVDYKVWAFDGKAAYIWVCFNRTPHSVECQVYDTDWNFHPEYSVSTPHYVLSNMEIPKPKCLKQMLSVAETLSKGFPELRCDLYEVDGKLYFGEMTFTASAGFNYFYSEQFRIILGKLCDLSKAKTRY